MTRLNKRLFTHLSALTGMAVLLGCGGLFTGHGQGRAEFFVYVLARGANAVKVFAGEADGSLREIEGAPTGSLPDDMAIDEIGRRLFVVSGSDDSMGVFEIASDGTLRHQRTIPVGDNPVDVAVQGDMLTVMCVNSKDVSLFRLNRTSGEINLLRTVATGANPNSALFSKALYVVNGGENSIFQYAENGVQLNPRRVQTGDSPQTLFERDGVFHLINFGDSSLQRYRWQDGTSGDYRLVKDGPSQPTASQSFRITSDGDLAYVFSSDLARSYRVGADGSFAPLLSDIGHGGKGYDIALVETFGKRFAYVSAFPSDLRTFQVGTDGNLTLINTLTGVPQPLRIQILKN